MNYNLSRVVEYYEDAKKLEPIGFKTLYLWLTECLDWAKEGPLRGVPDSLIERFGQMNYWERANTVGRLREHLHELTHKDFRKLVDEARSWDIAQAKHKSEL